MKGSPIAALAFALLAGSAEAGHCSSSDVPAYCCIVPCDSPYANSPSLYGVDTTPACGTAGATTMDQIHASASTQGCAPLTAGSCSFGPNAYAKCDRAVALGGSAALATFNQAMGITVTGDPHLSLPHGGRADFRGEDKEIYNFISAANVALNVMTETADFELHDESHPRHKHVHGSFLTQAHLVARTNTGKMLRVSFWADKIGQQSAGWANGTIDNEPVFSLGPKQNKSVDDISLRMTYASLIFTTPQFEITVTPFKFNKEKNVVGLHHRLDVNMELLVPEDTMAVAPHGIIGQGWDKDDKAIDGEKDFFPTSGEYTTYAMAKGAIEGTPNDYKVASKYATDFKFSRFDLKEAAPRQVGKLVEEGVLNAPKPGVKSSKVGSTEYDFTEM